MTVVSEGLWCKKLGDTSHYLLFDSEGRQVSLHTLWDAAAAASQAQYHGRCGFRYFCSEIHQVVFDKGQDFVIMEILASFFNLSGFPGREPQMGITSGTVFPGRHPP